MSALTLFQFGYWGWGNAVRQLVEAIDAVEAARGFAPPLFVDVRLSRSVRAVGFNGTAFESAVGVGRYRWLNGLGNLGIRDGGPMRLKNPRAVEQLLDLAENAAKTRQRVVFFCACPRPCNCHRHEVGRLALLAAANRQRVLETVEWPGGEPTLEGLKIELTDEEFQKVRRGSKSVPLRRSLSLAEIGAVPWYSLLTVTPQNAHPPSWRLVTGPAMFRSAGWYLPVYRALAVDTRAAMHATAIAARQDHGFAARRTRDARPDNPKRR